MFPHPGDAKLLPASNSSAFASRCTSPSLTPGSPESQISAHPVAEFVNLRDLTSGTFEATIIAPVQQFPPLPTLSTEDEEHKFALTATILPATPEAEPLDFTVSSDEPSFEASFCTELDSDDEFGFVDFGESEVVYHADKSQRLSPVEEEDFLSVHSFDSFSDDDSAHAGLLSPPASFVSDDCCRSRKMSRADSQEFEFENLTEADAHIYSHSEGQDQAPHSTTSESSAILKRWEHYDLGAFHPSTERWRSLNQPTWPKAVPD